MYNTVSLIAITFHDLFYSLLLPPTLSFSFALHVSFFFFKVSLSPAQDLGNTVLSVSSSQAEEGVALEGRTYQLSCCTRPKLPTSHTHSIAGRVPDIKEPKKKEIKLKKGRFSIPISLLFLRMKIFDFYCEKLRRGNTRLLAHLRSE